MKRTAILLEESLLLEVQQLAKERQVTVSQVIQQAVADYVESQRRSRSRPPVSEEVVPPSEPSEPSTEPARPTEEEPSPASAERQPTPVAARKVAQALEAEHQPTPAPQGSQIAQALWPALIAFILGGLSALFALLELLLAVEKFTGSAQPLGVALNHLVPGVLLVIVAVAFIFVALHLLRPRTV